MHNNKVTLREIQAADLPHFFSHQQQPEAIRMAAFTSPDPLDPDVFRSRWEWIVGHPNITKRTILCDQAVVGSVMSFVRDGQPEVTYWIDQEQWGKGIATRALAAFLAQQPAGPVYARAAADNLASIRVLEKCGFQITARERGFANARGCEIEEVVLERP